MKIPSLLWLFLIPVYLINYSVNIFPANGYLLGHQNSMLLHLKNNLIFNPSISRKLTLWNQSADCCQWHGVTCNNEGIVIALDLSEESISGGLVNSSVLFDLHYLQSLNLAFNNFSSTIPSELYKLNNLRYLNLSNAGFEGQIPHEISHLRRLVTLDLSSSFTSRHILKLEKPNLRMILKNLTDITELYLDGVKVSAKGQEWCHALSSLHNLRVLSMLSCNLSGPIDSSLAKLKSLTVLKLSHNNMSSTVPESFVKFSNLVTLQLRSCGLNGLFPEDIFQIPTLKVLDISDNQDLGGSLPNFTPHGSLHDMILRNTNFSGMLSGAISNLMQLSRIDLSNCKFNGKLPSSISKLTQLVYLDLSCNNFTGPLPSFNMSKNLTYLSLFHNHLSGTLPSSHFEGLKNLVSINLGFNFFNGSLPSSLCNLPNLRELILPSNHLSGLLDDFMIASPLLEILDLSKNSLQGPIPEFIFNLKRLRVIQLNLNRLNGTIKLNMIRGLNSLMVLGLSHNNLSVDIYSTDDGNLSPFPDFIHFMLASCKLREIPKFLRNQSTLLYLDLSDNEIKGGLPFWIWQLEHLLRMNLSKNLMTDLEGSVWNLRSNLVTIDLSSNQLQGPALFIPKFVVQLDYSNNRFSSDIPLDIGNHIPYANYLSLSNNSFQGQIPESFCNASSLLFLDLSYNNFVGMIPKCITLMSSILRVLNFGGNKLRGNILNTWPTSCDMRLLDLNDNFLEGTIPKSLANCQKLQVLNLRKNVLTDKFPCFLSNISTLRILDLRLNKLQGSIECPRTSGDWEMLHMVDLASNNFSGTIPKALLNSWKAMKGDKDDLGTEFGHLFISLVDNYEFMNFEESISHNDKYIRGMITKFVANISLSVLDLECYDNNYEVVDIVRYQNSIIITNKGQQMKFDRIQKVFTYLDMSGNNFEGPIPNELMQFKALNALNLSNNALSGHIPSSIGNLKSLESLDLSNNSLNGEIPTELASLSFLAYLNLSFNHLVGEIPTGTQIQSFDADSFKGNEGLYGPPLTHNCSNDGVTIPETPHFHFKNSIDWNFLSVELGCIFGFGIFIIPLMFWRRWRLWYFKHIDEMLHRIIPQLDFVYEQLEGKRYKTLIWSY